MRKITTITCFIQEISVLLDRGNSYSIEEVEKHIEDKDIVDWIEREFPFENNGIDFSLFKQENRDYLHDEYESILGGYRGQERRKWGIENNGLCLLISWGIEIIRNIEDHSEWC